MTVTALDRALHEPVALRPLPREAVELLVTLAAPPRLAAHLRAVHDVAWHLTHDIREAYPTFPFHRDDVLFGAATHDIGKVQYPEELTGPGSRHERAGYELLRAHGVDARRARFARNHASWTTPDISTEDLLVSVADKIWKAKRVPDLEDALVARICAATGDSRWQVFMGLDDICSRIAHDADHRLAFQGSSPRQL